MESARSYQSTKATYRRFSLMEYREGSLTYNGNGLNAAVTDGQNGNGQVQDNQEGEAETPEKTLYTLEDWQNSLSVRSSRVNMNRFGRANVMDNLRQVTLRYIFDLLFAGRRGQFDQWMQDRGLTSSTSNTVNSNQNLNWQGQTSMKVFTYTQESFV